MKSIKPFIVIHADWSVNASKRWLAQALWKDDIGYEVDTPMPVGAPASLTAKLEQVARNHQLVVVGFDFPIGIPLWYAERCGVQDYPGWLVGLEKGEWADFFSVAEEPAQIYLKRPFYPKRPGNARQAHLLTALEAPCMDALRRRCELAHPGRRAAAPLFWTLGGQQVGKAAISGWREVLIPLLISEQGTDLVQLWPFNGSLRELCQPGRIVVVETYPAEYYAHLNLVFKGGGKRSQSARIANAKTLLNWAHQAGIIFSSKLVDDIRVGFGASAEAEDRFDALAGLLGMLEVLMNLRSPGEPRDEPVRKIEGWIFGQAYDKLISS